MTMNPTAGTTSARSTFLFDEIDTPDRNVLGGKGSGLARMVRMGLPVPDGFVIGTASGREYLREGAISAQLREEVRTQIGHLEERSGSGFGDADAPLLVSVRSGAPVSMPGMMDTILNCGLTRVSAATLAEQTSNHHFAYSSYERLLHSFAVTVRGISESVVEELLLDCNFGTDPLVGLHGRCDALEQLIERETGAPFPDAWGQLDEAIEAVFKSWTSRRAVAYRRHKGISDEVGTAIVIQRMVFGNRGEDSCSGVAFTRDPATGASGAYGEVLFNAQGEDVVDGSHDADPLPTLGVQLPEAMTDLEKAMDALERDYRDMCDIEFTVEQGKLWILQTRVGQRSGRAAVKLAMAMLDEGLIDRKEALSRVSDDQFEAAQAPVLESVEDDRIFARGLAASPGAAVGPVTFDPDKCTEYARAGTPAVLIRPTTSPADMPGIIESAAVVTGRGGRTSHAAVVARGLNKPSVCGVGAVERVGSNTDDIAQALIAGQLITEGDIVSVDGDLGLVVRGAATLLAATTDDALARFGRLRDTGAH